MKWGEVRQGDHVAGGWAVSVKSLKGLRQVEILIAKPDGKRVWYTVDEEGEIDAFLDIFKETQNGEDRRDEHSHSQP